MKTFLIATIVILWSVASCKTDKFYDTRMHIKNNSDKTVLFYFQGTYPDTGLAIYNNVALDTNRTLATPLVFPDTDFKVKLDGSWESYFSHQIPSGKIEIFFFDRNILRTVPWDSIVKHYMVLKRYDLTLDSLEKMNWIVPYP